MAGDHLSGILGGERFAVTYLLAGDEAEARAKAEDICLEQTVEFPADLVPEGPIRDGIVGKVELLEPSGPGLYRSRISFAAEVSGPDLVQLLNVVYGNISIKPGIKVERMTLPESILRRFRGPRFGRSGLRALLGQDSRPLLCTALKPMGLSPAELADQAYRFALGGIDLIKDDHGIADQVFCPFEERVARCVEAVERANRETGRRSVYMPNITARADRLLPSARRAKELGAGALLICPALVGFDAMRLIADDDSVGLPIMAHPSFGGSFVTSPESGFSHAALYGGLMRLAGADATVYPNFGGRFAFTREECLGIAQASREAMGAIKPIFPAPGGGMTTDRAREMLEVYGKDFILLIGGGLHRRSADLAENARHFLALLESL